MTRKFSRGWLAIVGFSLLGVSAFVIGSQVNTAGTARADDPRGQDVLSPDATPWYWPLLEEEDLKPRPDGVYNGILVSDEFQRTVAGCTEENADRGDVARAYDSVIDPRPAYLPAGVELLSSESMMCGSIAAWTRLEYLIPETAGVSDYGGILTIYRSRQEGVNLDVGADRIVESSVRGAPALIVPPLTDDGFGRSAVVISEPFGVTVIKASGITLDELLRIASGLGSDGGAS